MASPAMTPAISGGAWDDPETPELEPVGVGRVKDELDRVAVSVRTREGVELVHVREATRELRLDPGPDVCHFGRVPG